MNSLNNNVDIFNAYFDAFEEAYDSNNWEAIAPFFAEDMVYNTAGAETKRGRTAAIDYLKTDVESLDRRFDSRAFDGNPEITGEGNTVTMVFTVRYQLEGAPDLVITGKEVATFQDGKIRQMDDVFDDEAIAGFGAWMDEHGARLA